jgi:hypothetical protein
MFERSVDWTKVVGMIGDIVKGTSTVSLRQYAKSSAEDENLPIPVFGWDYHRVQVHGGDTAIFPALVSDERLADILMGLTAGAVEAFVYEVDGAENFDGGAQALLREFSAIRVTTVKLSVGAVHLAWFLVSLNTNRDVVHWKMRYHERTRNSESQFSAEA